MIVNSSFQFSEFAYNQIFFSIFVSYIANFLTTIKFFMWMSVCVYVSGTRFALCYSHSLFVYIKIYFWNQIIWILHSWIDSVNSHRKHKVHVCNIRVQFVKCIELHTTSNMMIMFVLLVKHNRLRWEPRSFHPSMRARHSVWSTRSLLIAGIHVFFPF